MTHRLFLAVVVAGLFASAARAQPARPMTLAELAWRMDCGAVSLVQRGNRQELVGVAAEETVAELQAAHRATPPARRPDWAVSLFASHPDYCRAVELGRVAGPADPGAFTVSLRMAPGRAAVQSGEPLTFQVRAGMPGFLYIDLLTRSNDSQSRAVVEHLIPRDDPVNRNLNQPLTYSGRPDPFTVLERTGGFHGWSAYLPEGMPASVDLAIAIWVARRPLDLVREGDVEGDATAYLRALQAAVASARRERDVFVRVVAIPIVPAP